MKPLAILILSLFAASSPLFAQGAGSTVMTGTLPQIKTGQLTITSDSNPLCVEVLSEQPGIVIKGMGHIAAGSNPFKYALLKVLDFRTYASQDDYQPLLFLAYGTPSTSPNVTVGVIHTGLNGGIYFRNDASIIAGGDLTLRNLFTFTLGTGTNAGKLVVRENQTGTEHPLW